MLMCELSNDSGRPDSLWERLRSWFRIPPRNPSFFWLIRVIECDRKIALGGPDTSIWTGAYLTDDGRTIVTLGDENADEGDSSKRFNIFDVDRAGGLLAEGGSGAVFCWDVPAGKPLRWVFGIPLAVGMLLVSLRAGWRWVRRRPAVTVAAPAQDGAAQ